MMILLTDKGKTIDVRELATKFTTDVIGSTAFGLDTNSFKDPNAEFRKHGVMMFDTNRSFEIIAITFIPILCRLTGMTVLSKQTDAFLRKVFWEMITQRERSGETRNDLIDILIDLKINHGENIEGFSKHNAINNDDNYTSSCKNALTLNSYLAR